MNTSTLLFWSHIARYVGVGMISGSIVHAGTLGGNVMKYVVLVVLGILVFLTGIYLEQYSKGERLPMRYIIITVIVSIGTGMVSGGVQHYLDGPYVAALLIPAGLLLAYISFIYRDYRKQYSVKDIFVKTLLFACIGAVLYAGAYMLSRNEETTAGIIGDGHTDHAH
jgi:peptidoglycan/LPS O-acetylase OafA/YrhL